MKYPKIYATVKTVLKDQARGGSTTTKSATLLSFNRMHRPGGDLLVDMRFYGIGTADLIDMWKDMISLEVKRQLKAPLSEHDEEYVFKPGLRRDLLAQITGAQIPTWIAIEEGADAMWMHFKSARDVHWQANLLLKQKKSVQTMAAASIPRDILDIMQTFGLRSLSDVFQ